MLLDFGSYVLEGYINANVGENPPKMKLTVPNTRT
jgi:hypothetical protein